MVYDSVRVMDNRSGKSSTTKGKSVAKSSGKAAVGRAIPKAKGVTKTASNTAKTVQSKKSASAKGAKTSAR